MAFSAFFRFRLYLILPKVKLFFLMMKMIVNMFTILTAKIKSGYYITLIRGILNRRHLTIGRGKTAFILFV